MDRRVLLVGNPLAGRGRGKSIAGLSAHLSARGVAHESWVPPTRPKPAEVADRARSYDVVVVAGGDGTLHDIAQAVIGLGPALAILPVGTGNDFARTLGIHRLDDALDTISTGKVVPLDAVRFRSVEDEGWMLNVAGTGFDAAVADDTNRNRSPWLRGTAAYLVSIARCLRTYRPVTVRANVDGESIEAKIMLAAVANARSYGGGMLISPRSRVDDAHLDLVTVGDIPKSEFLRQFPKVFRGDHLSHPKVRHIAAKVVEWTVEPDAPLLVDGEVRAPGPARFEVVAGAMPFVVPTTFGVNPTA